MNKLAHKIHMKSTHYNNPHGLVDKFNHSCANDIALLSSFAMRNFPQIK